MLAFPGPQAKLIMIIAIIRHTANIRRANYVIVYYQDKARMDLNQIEAFLAVAQERTFSKAAQKLHRTQSAISQTVRKLEDEVGEPLFDRSSRGGVLTDAGQVLKDYAEKLL